MKAYCPSRLTAVTVVFPKVKNQGGNGSMHLRPEAKEVGSDRAGPVAAAGVPAAQPCPCTLQPTWRRVSGRIQQRIRTLETRIADGTVSAILRLGASFASLSQRCRSSRLRPTATPAPPGNPATAQELPQVTVIGNTPLPGLGLPLNQIPANVQTADSEDMQRQQTLDLADYLNNNFSGINASESADNPFQLDINYHGFTASPLLGTPEGLSVYVDGVRVNESFGDTVNWDLIPQSAISTVTLMSGSNPVFGLNTLGGALSVRTKSGHDDPGTEFEAYGGSFGRRSFEGETGGEFGNFDYFLTGNYFDETGWRDNSPTRVYQGFGKVGWQNDKTDIDLSYTYADTSLYGNGATPTSMLEFRRQASYTPDFTAESPQFREPYRHAVPDARSCCCPGTSTIAV